MKITERIVSPKRHTIGYVISRRRYTRDQAIELAQQGKVDGVRISNGPKGKYLTSSTDSSLYDLPIRIGHSVKDAQPMSSAPKTTKAKRSTSSSRVTKTASNSR